MAKKLYDYEYVLNLEYKVKLLEVTSAAQKERIKMLEKNRDFGFKCLGMNLAYTPQNKIPQRLRLYTCRLWTRTTIAAI